MVCVNVGGGVGRPQICCSVVKDIPAVLIIQQQGTFRR
jgi:hypothetical protein